MIALAALPGEPTEPSPKSSKSFPAAMTGTTPASAARVERRGDDVARRLDLRLAEREVDHVHAVGDGGLDPRGDLRRVAVEAEPGVGIVSTL